MSTNRFRWQTMFRGRGYPTLVTDRAFKNRRKAANYCYKVFNQYEYIVDAQLWDLRTGEGRRIAKRA